MLVPVAHVVGWPTVQVFVQHVAAPPAPLQAPFVQLDDPPA
jgi:hypothetical protein